MVKEEREVRERVERAGMQCLAHKKHLKGATFKNLSASSLSDEIGGKR